MGFNILFPWNSLRIGRSAWVEQFIVIVFFAFFCGLSFSADRPFTTENKTKVIVKDLLERSYNRTYNLPAVIPNSGASTMQEVRRANVLRSIAKKATRASGALYSKHPITGLAVTFGLGYFTDELIDSAFQKFTSASQDSLGFYVMAKDPKTGRLEKVYLEEEPSLFNPAFVNLQDNIVFTYEDAYGTCQTSSYDETLNCAINKNFELKMGKASSNSVLSDFKVVSKEKSPIYADGLFVNYSYKQCFKNSSNCFTQRSFFTVRVIKKEQRSPSAKAQVVWGGNVVPDDKVVLQDDAQISTFAKNAVSLNSDEFTDEERKVISNIQPSDVRKYFTDPSLKAKDLSSFRYSDDMFDDVVSSSNPKPKEGEKESDSTSISKSVDFSSPAVDMPDINPPTALQILEPFNEFFPSLKDFNISEREIQCPVWSGHIPYLEANVTLDRHCDYVERNKGIISSLMLLIWGIVSLRVLLSA
ncbi:MAG: hypothetical protein E7E14_00320 [Haemophilus parainfluenzae]|nr:hypothetical protein [Haemophilus parainfluenzae]